MPSHPLLNMEPQQNGPWGIYQGGLLQVQPDWKVQALCCLHGRGECIPGGALGRVARGAHLLLHQVQRQGSTMRQGRRWKDIILAALPAQTLKVEGGPPMG